MLNFIGQLLLTISAVFVGFWILLSINGWSKLAQKYRTDEIPRTLVTVQQGHFRGSSGRGYTKMPLKVGVTNEGLYLAISSPFDFLMSPVLVPWNQRLTWKSFNSNSSQKYFKLHLGNPEVIILQLNGDAIRELENKYSESILFNKLGSPS